MRDQQHLEQAKAILQPLLVREPENSMALTLLAEVLLDQGHRADGATLLGRALAASPNSLETNRDIGNLLLAQHQYPEAMDRFETALAALPTDPAAREGERTAATELALSARQSGHPEVALQVLRHACSKLPDDPQLLLDRGVQATELQQLPEAEQALHAALALDPKNPTIFYALARVATDEQHMPEAEADLKAYLAVRPDDASAHFGLGHLYAMEQRPDEARAEFETSLKLQPKQTESYFQLGDLDLKAAQDAAAAALFQRVLTSDPNHAGALTGMGELALHAKQYAAAEQWLTRAEKADPGYPPPHYYRGLALARLGRKDEAEQEFRLGDGRPHAMAQDTPQANQP